MIKTFKVLQVIFFRMLLNVTIEMLVNGHSFDNAINYPIINYLVIIPKQFS